MPTEEMAGADEGAGGLGGSGVVGAPHVGESEYMYILRGTQEAEQSGVI